MSDLGTVPVKCNECGHEFTAPFDSVGIYLNCPKCKGFLSVPVKCTPPTNEKTLEMVKRIPVEFPHKIISSKPPSDDVTAVIKEVSDHVATLNRREISEFLYAMIDAYAQDETIAALYLFDDAVIWEAFAVPEKKNKVLPQS